LEKGKNPEKFSAASLIQPVDAQLLEAVAALACEIARTNYS
jgi:hypothetical protein